MTRLTSLDLPTDEEQPAQAVGHRACVRGVKVSQLPRMVVGEADPKRHVGFLQRASDVPVTCAAVHDLNYRFNPKRTSYKPRYAHIAVFSTVMFEHVIE